jgi:hypothetical protein
MGIMQEFSKQAISTITGLISTKSNLESCEVEVLKSAIKPGLFEISE